MKRLLIYIMAALVISGCRNNQNGSTTTDLDAQIAALEPLSYTVFADKTELFVEFRPFIKGHESAFAAHLNDLDKFKPVAEGTLQVILKNEQFQYDNTVNAPSVPGIFRPVITPAETGIYTLTFLFRSPQFNETIVIDSIKVYADIDEALADNVHEAGGDEIVYLKEQAWKTEFATQEVTAQPFWSVISTSAKVKSQPQAEVVLNAQSSGQFNLLTVLGASVRKDEIVATISGAGLENSITTKLNEYRISYEKSRADYERTAPLSETQAISQKDFLEVKSHYLQDSLRYFQFSGKVSKNSLKITAPFDGIVSDVLIQNGEFTETGIPLIQITNKNELLIEAFINQADYQSVQGIFDANFKNIADNKTITLADLKGEVKTANAFVNENISRIPVNFSVQNNGLIMPGMFLEAYIMTNKKDNAIVLPLSAIIEEQGRYFVFVEVAGESFIKREVILNGNDGISVEIAKGLQIGERVVTKGTQPIKLSSMAGGLPLHGHTH